MTFIAVNEQWPLSLAEWHMLSGMTWKYVMCVCMCASFCERMWCSVCCSVQCTCGSAVSEWVCLWLIARERQRERERKGKRGYLQTLFPKLRSKYPCYGHQNKNNKKKHSTPGLSMTTTAPHISVILYT